MAPLTGPGAHASGATRATADIRPPELLFEQDDSFHYDALKPTPARQGFLQSIVSRHDWYKNGGGTFPYYTCSDPGAMADFQARKKLLASTVTTGGNLIVSPATPMSGSGQRRELPPHNVMDRNLSRKRSFDSSTSESEEIWIRDCWTPRRRLN